MSERGMTLAQCEAPEVYRGQVDPAWIDVNGHMNVAYYVLAFDYGIDGLWHSFGLSDERRDDTGSSTFAVESHVRYVDELLVDETFVVCSRILAWDDKRLHQFQWLFNADSGTLCATCEWLHLHINLNHRRVSPWPQDLLGNIASHSCAASDAAWPSAAGQQINIPSPHPRPAAR